MIEIKNLSKKFGSSFGLNDINLSLKKEESVIVMGQNGAGKTTLIRSILGEQIPTTGTIRIAGIDPLKDRTEALKHISFVPQLPPPIKLSVKELMNYASVLSGAEEKKIFDICEKLELDIEKHFKKIFFKLSGGMKQKLLIAIALAKESDILIFDEPTANLDIKGRESFYELMRPLGNGRLLIFISHRIEEIKSLINRKIELDLGKVVNDEKII
ncbi:MAG: ABC transporter ATP-binding protein [Campylobacteraceae bacterium]|jgi:ABC-2 type transport system ATP-binding protein|nr:ABC transporter ATP-binding protein [Campylobacteraceae bacterium]